MRLRNGFPANSTTRPASIMQPELRTVRRFLSNLPLFAIFLATAAVFFFSSGGTRLVAQTATTADTKDASSIDPDAIEAVKKMGTYLRSLKSFQVVDTSTQDDVLDDGMIVQTNSKIDLLAERPNRLRVEVTSDDRHRLYLYDGTNLTVWGRLVNYYATVPAPPTIRELFENAMEKYDISLPLYDIFNWGTHDDDISKIKTAIDLGPSAVEGVTCEHYAFHQEGADWQLWIQLGQFPLPRRLVITTLTDDSRPQHSDTLDWNLAPSFNDSAFVFHPPQDAKRVALAVNSSDATDTGK